MHQEQNYFSLDLEQRAKTRRSLSILYQIQSVGCNDVYCI